MTRTLVIGDVHGCASELQTMLQMIEPTRCILVGDVFRKGPDPMGVWRIIQQWSIEAVFGNHEAALLQESEHYPSTLVRWVESLPLWIEGQSLVEDKLQSWRVIHAGVNPFHIQETTRANAIVLRRWPDDQDTQNPFWWELYSGDALIIYGHDAARGLQDHRPRTLGLDSGCVYGNGLTGYVIESSELIHVPSQRVYVPIRRS